MDSAMRLRCADSLQWWFRRNPTYLLSAACIAVGARMLLVSPTGVPGDVGFIVLTLTALQLYEWSVTGFLLLLHRSRRSPEDEPSLVVVAALFWTGPLVATMEMAAQRADLGIILAAGACAVALSEFQAVRHLMRWRIGWPAQLLAAGCVLMVAAAQPLLKVRSEQAGTNELLLYALWWLLAGMVLMGLPAVRRCCGKSESESVPACSGASTSIELGLIAAALVAGAAHLVALNHAFYGHARPFYASPFILSLSVVAFELARRISARRGWLMAGCCWLPAIAVAIAVDSFDRAFPLEELPLVLRDPLLMILPLAALAWWFGYVRHGWDPLLHAGIVCCAASLLRGVKTFMPADGLCPAPSIAGVPMSRVQVVLALYVLAVYLAVFAWLRRSRITAISAVAAQAVGLAALVWRQASTDALIVLLCSGWSALIIVHLATSRPRLVLRLLPLAFLTGVTWTYQRQAGMYWAATGHAAAMICLLVLAGHWWRWTRYRSAGCAIGVLLSAPPVVQWACASRPGQAGLVVVCGFVLLVLGASISWHKPALVRATQKVAAVEEPGE